MTREEFRGALSDIDEGGRLSHSEEARKAEILLLDHDKEQRAEIARLRNLCLETYQVVGSLASDADMFEAPETIKALDNLSAAGHGEALPHTSLLPYPASEKIARLRKALHVALINLRAWNGEETWELYRKSPEIQSIQDALKETP